MRGLASLKQVALNEVPEGSGSEGEAQEATFGALPFRNSLNVNKEDRTDLELQHGRSPPKATGKKSRASFKEAEGTAVQLRPHASAQHISDTNGQCTTDNNHRHDGRWNREVESTKENLDQSGTRRG